ncbi:hypothetical protein CURTO8I2_160049 [Curtobacterium sp. 8I-2]|nr:hypothetical protein CURTO8I2_160049 [Curtobacterium sp. 8I-2]
MREWKGNHPSGADGADALSDRPHDGLEARGGAATRLQAVIRSRRGRAGASLGWWDAIAHQAR